MPICRGEQQMGSDEIVMLIGREAISVMTVMKDG